MRRIRAATILSSFRAAVYGGRAAAAAPFSTANPKPKPHTKPPSDIFGVFVRNQLKNEGRARKILFREYGGRATKDDDDESYEEEKVAKTNTPKFSVEELEEFVNNIAIKLHEKCENGYAEIFEKAEKKKIQDDRLLRGFDLVTIAMNRELDYEKFLCEILGKIRKNILKLDTEQEESSFEEALVPEAFQLNLANVVKMKAHFMAYEVIEKVAKKVGNENLRKIAEKELDAIVTNSFAFLTVIVHMNIPRYKFSMLVRRGKVSKRIICSEEELNAFLTNLAVECGSDFENFENIVNEIYYNMKNDLSDDETVNATKNYRVDKLAEIAEEELYAFLTNSFTAKLMMECEPKYEKRFREIIEKVRKKMILDDRMLQAFELVTDFMKCEPEYEKLLCEVLVKVREKISQDGGNENILKIEKLAKLDMKVGFKYDFEEENNKLVTGEFLKKLRHVEKMKAHFMAYEVLEKVAKKVGNEQLRKIAEKELDALVIDCFASEIVMVRMNIPWYKFSMLMRRGKLAERIICSEEELDAFLTNLAIECGRDVKKYESICKEIDKIKEDDKSDGEILDTTQYVRVDKLAEIAEEELYAFLTNSFTAKLMIECEPKYEKRFREIIEKVSKKMIRDDRMLQAFELVTDFMKCEPEYEKLLCEVLVKVCKKISQYGGNENIRKIEELTKLDMDMNYKDNFEEELGKFITGEFLKKHGELAEGDPASSNFLHDFEVCSKYFVMSSREQFVLLQELRKISEQLKGTHNIEETEYLNAREHHLRRRSLELTAEKSNLVKCIGDAYVDGTWVGILEIRWQPPPSDWVKLNSDAGHKWSQNLTVTGGLIRDSSSIYLTGFTATFDPSDPFRAELSGLLTGLRWARKLGHQKVIAELDNESAVLMVLGKASCGKKHKSLVKEIKKLIHEDWEVDVRYVPREANYAAHGMVEIAYKTNEKFHEYLTAPNELFYRLCRDAFGRSHIRRINARKN